MLPIRAIPDTPPSLLVLDGMAKHCRAAPLTHILVAATLCPCRSLSPCTRSKPARRAGAVALLASIWRPRLNRWFDLLVAIGVPVSCKDTHCGPSMSRTARSPRALEVAKRRKLCSRWRPCEKQLSQRLTLAQLQHA